MESMDTDPDHDALVEENERLKEEVAVLRKFIDSMEHVMEAVEKAPPETEIVELLEDILGNVMATIGAIDGSLLVLDEDTNELVFVISQGKLPQENLHWKRLPPGEGIAGWVVQHRRATIVNDTHTDNRFYGEIDSEFEFNTRSLLAAPLEGGGRVLGVIELLNKSDNRLFSLSDQTLLTIICRFAGELLYTLIQVNQEQSTNSSSPFDN